MVGRVSENILCQHGGYFHCYLKVNVIVCIVNMLFTFCCFCVFFVRVNQDLQAPQVMLESQVLGLQDLRLQSQRH